MDGLMDCLPANFSGILLLDRDHPTSKSHEKSKQQKSENEEIEAICSPKKMLQKERDFPLRW